MAEHEEHGPLPLGRGPRPRYSRQLLDETIAVWQPHYATRLTDADAAEIIENVMMFARAFLVSSAADAGPPTSSLMDENRPDPGGHLSPRRQTG